MASIYQREASPYWWIKYRDAAGVIHRESTFLRVGHGPDTRSARELEAQRTLDERRTPRHCSAERWANWVDDFLDDQYSRQPASLLRFRTAWRTVKLFLDEQRIELPRQLNYDHCRAYLKWREKADVRSGKYRACRNTALLEIKFIGLLMKHAVRRGFAQGNPCAEIGVERDPAKIIAEYTDDHLRAIADAIAAEPAAKRAFLQPSFLIALHHGVRLMETNVNPRRDVRLWTEPGGERRGEITFHQKMGRTRTKPLHPALLDFFSARADRKTAFPVPKSFAKEWFNFLNRSGLKARLCQECREHDRPVEVACFHSLRVTVNNRLRRAGVPDVIRKRYLSHEKAEDVNELYNRVLVDEMRVCHAALDFHAAISSLMVGGSL